MLVGPVTATANNPMPSRAMVILRGTEMYIPVTVVRICPTSDKLERQETAPSRLPPVMASRGGAVQMNAEDWVLSPLRANACVIPVQFGDTRSELLGRPLWLTDHFH